MVVTQQGLLNKKGDNFSQQSTSVCHGHTAASKNKASQQIPKILNKVHN